MDSVWISCKVILAEVLRGVGYTFQKYGVSSIGGGKFVGSVSFLAGSHGDTNTHGTETCYGLPEETAEKAEESAAFYTIKLISSRLHVDVKDINYAQWFVLQSENSKHERDAKIREQSIVALTKSVSRFEDGWKCMIDQVEGLLDNMSFQILDDNVNGDMNHLANVNGGASDAGMEDNLKVVITAARAALNRAQQGLEF
ncbi:unnamed protein product [Alopecurus aequalis]